MLLFLLNELYKCKKNFKELRISSYACKRKQKKGIIEILDTNGIDYSITTYDGHKKICISFHDASHCCNSTIIVKTCNKDVLFKVYLNNIMYIAIENRKSVVYLIDKKNEMHYSIDYRKENLNRDIFVQPHYSYIVNLNYVYMVTKDFVKTNYIGKEYSVYISSRKIVAFKQAFLKFGKQKSGPLAKPEA